MNRQVLIDCGPYLLGIVTMLGVLALMIRLTGARLRLRNLKRLHSDEVGGVQSLSFVMTIPIFIVIMMFIVQLTQLTIARVVIEYAAFAAARSAVVWVPANLGPEPASLEQENRVGQGRVWINEVQGPDSTWYDIYQLDTSIDSDSPKVQRIRLAAAMACMSISPSRDYGNGSNHIGNNAATPLTRAFFALAPSRSGNTRIPARIRNKLAYALSNTEVEVYAHHRRDQPFLAEHEVLRDIYEFTDNEIGFHDQLHVRVTHRFALLPGPGRLLARFVARPDRDDPDTVAQRINQEQGIYTVMLAATARVQNEGEKSFWPRFEDPFGQQGPIIMTAREAELLPELPYIPPQIPSQPIPDPFPIPPTLPPLDDPGIRFRRSTTDDSQSEQEPADDCAADESHALRGDLNQGGKP